MGRMLEIAFTFLILDNYSLCFAGAGMRSLSMLFVSATRRTTWANETKLLTLLLVVSSLISWFSIRIKLLIFGKKLTMNQEEECCSLES